MRFVSREEALKLLEDIFKGHCPCCANRHALKGFARWRNYEIERELDSNVVGDGEGWCVTDWCPFDGRHCKVSAYIPYPHPPLRCELPMPPETGDPWRCWAPGMTEKLR